MSDEIITVTQADRRIAVDAMRSLSDVGHVVGCCNITPTEADEMAAFICTFFARHRQQSEARLRAENEALREALEAVQRARMDFVSEEGFYALALTDAALKAKGADHD